MRFKRIYIEITNVCNLNCSFCTPHTRANRFMDINEFKNILSKIKGYTEYIYLHVKGEPLLHPNFDEMVKIAYDMDFKINLTTNAILLEKHLNITKFLRQINVSFHATNDLEIIKTCKKINDCIINFRIWTMDESAETLKLLQKEFDAPSIHVEVDDIKEKSLNYTLAPNIFLSLATKFDWPDITSDALSDGYCHGLISQLAILADGTVTPCCLDNNGDINLGNIFIEELEDILEKEKTTNIIDGFKRRICTEELCKKCTFKNKF